ELYRSGRNSADRAWSTNRRGRAVARAASRRRCRSEENRKARGRGHRWRDSDAGSRRTGAVGARGPLVRGDLWHTLLGDVAAEAGGDTAPKVLISAEDVVQGKPHPEPYLKGAARLGFRPDECLVIEDARAGIEA